MTSQCADCPDHERELVWSLAAQSLLIFHKCKKTGMKLFPQTSPIYHCIHREEVKVEV